MNKWFVRASVSALLLSVHISFCATTEAALPEEKLIVVVIPSYKNADWYEKNLSSVLMQEYTNFYVIYTDDCSPDGTGQLVADFIEEYGAQDKISLVRNAERKGALCNLYNMIHSCPPEAIVVTLDGDDWFPDNQVLATLNRVYSHENVWLTYGQFKVYPTDERGWCAPMPQDIIEHNAFREFEHLPSHLRTFYASLFQKIALKDLLYLGQFYPMTWDIAMMMPMIEMAGERHKCMDEVLYVYNNANIISDHRISRQLQAYLSQVARAQKRYERLDTLPEPEQVKHSQADIIIFSDHSPETLSMHVAGLKKYMAGLGSIHVVFFSYDEQTTQAYQAVQHVYPELQLHHVFHHSRFKEQFTKAFAEVKSSYLLFSVDAVIVSDGVNLSVCIDQLERTQAYGFYFNVSREKAFAYPRMPLLKLNDGVCAWHFAGAQDQWSFANSIDMALYRKTDQLAQYLQCSYDQNPRGFEAIWANEGSLDRIGLCYQDGKTFQLTSHKGCIHEMQEDDLSAF